MHHHKLKFNGKEAFVNVNSDWSGTAYVTWEEHGTVRTAEIPGLLVKAMVKECTIEMLESTLGRIIDNL